MRPISYPNSKDANPNADVTGKRTAPRSEQRHKQKSGKASGGSPALKSFRMLGFKESDSSPDPSGKVSIEGKDEGLAEVPQEQLLFTEPMVMDYVTLKGIENRFGVESQDIPVAIFEDLIDNALDQVETLALTPINHDFMPEIRIQITSDGDKINLEVSNSGTTPNFTLDRFQNIFNFYNFSSTKRNQYKISRGAFGNGLKAILGMSHALATENYNYEHWTSLKIRTGNKLYLISLVVDKINGKDRPVSTDIKTEECTSDKSFHTSVKIDIPIDRNSETETLNKLLDTFKNFTILNPHITFHHTLNGKTNTYPQVQKFKSHWNNLDSIYHYSYKEFENLILSSTEDKMSLYDFVTSIHIVESSRLNKESWNIPIRDVYYDRRPINKLYDKLKELFGPKLKLDLPYDMRMKPRKDAIVKRFSQWGINIESIKYQSYNGPSNSNSENGSIEFPYFFEVAEITTVNHTVGYEIISGINSSVTKLESVENPDKFRWTSKNNWAADIILFILQDCCGYSDDIKKFRKSGRIVFMHLISPRIDWKGYGKTQIDFKPFNNLGQFIYDTCKGGIKQSSPNKVTQKAILTAYLKQRQTNVLKDPNIVVTDRLTPSDVWYSNRPELQRYGINIEKNTRRNFTALIRVICEENFHVNMEELGIFAADRAQLYFDGQWRDVGFDDLHSLKFKGTDLIIDEKEGMTETMTPLADKKGLALLFTRGFATKYVRDLSELSKNTGCNVSVLSDYDDSGVLLASKLKVPRLGIDPETLEYFNLKREEVEETYTPKNHLNSIRGLVNEEEFEYLSEKRIEINSIKTKVGTEKLWEWIIYRLSEVFPNRNYNRAIEVPKVVKPDDLKKLYAKIENGLKSIIKSEYEKEVERLTDVVGLIDDVVQRRIDIEKRLQDVITNNQDYQDFMNRFNNLVDSHPFFNGNGESALN